MINILGRGFAIDLRSLGLFRIAIGLVLFLDLLIRFHHLPVLHGPAPVGILPLDDQVRATGAHWEQWSFHSFVSDNLTVLRCVVGFQILTALALLVGYRPRLAAALSFVLYASLLCRSPYGTCFGDALLKVQLFWAAWLPLGARYAIGRRRRESDIHDQDPSILISIPGAALLIQLCLVYWMTAFHKHGDAWLHGDAVRIALSTKFSATPVGSWMLTWPDWTLRVLTWSTLAMEFLLPFLAISPWKRVWCRSIACVGFIAFHAGLMTGINFGLFQWMCIAMWIAFLPLWGWVSNGRERELRVVGSEKISTLCCTIMLGWVICFNLASIHSSPVVPDRIAKIAMPWKAESFGKILRLNITWNMYAPSPPQWEGFLTAEVETDDGGKRCLFLGGQPLSEWPADGSSAFPNSRLREFLANYLELDALGVPGRKEFERENLGPWKEKCGWRCEHVLQWIITRSGVTGVGTTDRPVRLIYHVEPFDEPGVVYEKLLAEIPAPEPEVDNSESVDTLTDTDSVPEGVGAKDAVSDVAQVRQ